MNATRRNRERSDVVTSMIKRLKEKLPYVREDVFEEIEKEARSEHGGRDCYVYAPPKMSEQKREQVEALIGYGVPRRTAYRKAG
jgi:hypothetical protein